MDYREIVATVREGKKKAFFLYSQDEQLILEVRHALRKEVLTEENSMSHIRLDGNKVTFDELQNALSTYSMFNEEILVEVSNCGFMESDTAAALRELLSDYLKDPREDLCFFGYYKYDNELSKRNFYLDGLKKKIHGRSMIEHVDVLKPKGLVSVIEEKFREEGVEAPKNISIFISEIFKGSTLQLEKELDKLIAYTQGRAITKEDVLGIMAISDERHIMNLLDMVFTERGLGRNVRDILNLVNDLIYRGERPEMIMGVIGSRLRLLFQLKGLKEARASMPEIQKHLRTGSAWYAGKMTKTADAISFKEYARIYDALLQHEYVLKTTSVDSQSLLEMLLLSILNAKELK